MRRLASNFLSTIGGDVLRRLLGFCTIAYLARTITTEDFGLLNIGFTVLSYALMASSGGMNMFGAREIARGLGDELVSSLVSVKLAASLIVYALTGIVVLLFVSSPTLAAFVLLLCVSLFIQAFLLDWFFQGKEQMYIIGMGRFVAALVYFLLTVIFVHSSADLLRVAFAAIAGDLLATTLLFAVYRKQRPGARLRFSLRGWKAFVTQTVPLGAGTILAHFSINLPPIVIGIVMTNTDVGMYSAAGKMVFFLLMFDRVLGTLLLPASARLFTLDPDTLAERLNTALRWILITALPLCAGGTLLAGQLMTFLFGSQYLPAAVVLRVLIWYMLFTMIHTVYTSGIIAVGKEKEYSRVMMVSAALYALSVAVCTKLFGLVGASAAVVGSEALTLVLMRRAFHTTMKTIVPRSLPMILAAVLVMTAVLLVLPSLHVALAILIGAGVYGLILFVTRTLTAADLLSLVRRT